MKKTVLTFGLLSGALSVATMAGTVPFIESGRYPAADVLGYTSMVVSALMVFFAIRSHRDHVGGGRITFGRGMAVGLLVTLVSCACAVVAFEAIYFHLVPDFGEKFASCMVQRARASGADAQEVETVARQARELKQLYDHPATNAALTFATSFPLGLVVTVVSAAILRKTAAR
jgi:hypothetical protein